MLLAIRERVMGFLGWVILGLIFITFAFFGLDSYLQSSNPTYAARVNDVTISMGHLEQAYSRLNVQMRERLGDAFDPDLVDQDRIRRAALDQLVAGELLSQGTEAAGFAVSDAAIAAFLNDIDEFKVDGAFSKERYDNLLRLQGYSPEQFEYDIRRDLRNNQLQRGIVMSAAGSDDYVSRIYSLDGQQRRFDTVTIAAAAVAGEVRVSDEEVQAHFEQHQDRYRTAEQARVQYIELDAAAIALPADFTDEQIQAEYDANAEKYVTPEERRVRHILVAAEQTKEAVIEAAIKADDVYERLLAGEDFAAVAAEVSDDPVSASNGGDLGFFPQGVMSGKFDDAAFAQPVGEISEPVQTDFGFHIIEVLEVKPQEAVPLADVRDELIAALQSTQREDRYYELFEELGNLSYEVPDELQGTAEELGLALQHSDKISRSGGPGIGVHDKVVAAIFSDEVLLEGNNSELVEIGESHVVVLRIEEHIKSQPQQLDDVRTQVVDDVKKDKTRALLQQRGEQYMNALRAGELTLGTLAEQLQTEVAVNPLLPRRGAGPEAVIVETAYGMRAPRDGTTGYAGLFDASGDYVIVALHEVRDGVLETLPEGQRKMVGRGLSQIIGTSEMQLIEAILEADAEVTIPGDEDS